MLKDDLIKNASEQVENSTMFFGAIAWRGE